MGSPGPLSLSLWGKVLFLLYKEGKVMAVLLGGKKCTVGSIQRPVDSLGWAFTDTMKKICGCKRLC